ncbi:MAG: FtsB family cell division protein [Bacteroidales bacterium]
MLRKTSKKAFIYIVITVVALFVIIFADTYSLSSTIIEKSKVRALEKQKQKILLDIEQNKAQIKAISNDKQAIERVARERLHMKKKDEDVYIIRESDEE